MRKPEAGDVWADKRNIGDKIYILFELHCKGDFEVIGKGGSYALSSVVINENCKYLGKAKANINDLFEVQDEYRD